jgi:hypothetical protein
MEGIYHLTAIWEDNVMNSVTVFSGFVRLRTRKNSEPSRENDKVFGFIPGG